MCYACCSETLLQESEIMAPFLVIYEYQFTVDFHNKSIYIFQKQICVKEENVLMSLENGRPLSWH